MGGAGVVVVSAEEDVAETIAPRLDDFGANMSNISILDTVPRNGGQGEAVESQFKLPDDMGVLAAEIDRMEAVLVILDPLHSIVNGKVSIYRNQSARSTIMEPLQALAKAKGCAILIAGHFVKGVGPKTDLLDAAGGSGGIVDFARVVHAILLDPENPGERSMLKPIKNNLTTLAPTMLFQRLLDSPVEYVRGELPSVEQAQKVRRLSMSRQNILELLTKTAPTPLNSAQISRRLRLTDDNVRYHLADMFKKGMIASPGRGVYTIVPPAQEPEEKVEKSASQNSQTKPPVEPTQANAVGQKVRKSSQFLQGQSGPLPDPISSAKTHLMVTTNGHSTPDPDAILTAVLA